MGATAVAMTPVTATHLSLPTVQVPSAAQVALAGFDSPLTELLNTVVLGTNYLFNGDADPADPINWSFSGIGNAVAALLTTTDPDPLVVWTPVYSRVGLLPQIIDDALPIISQLGYNGSDYLQATTTSLWAAGYTLSEGLWNLPENVIDAVQASDLDALIGAFIDPLIEAASYLQFAGGYVLTGLVNRASAVFDAVVDLVPALFETALGHAQVLGQALIKPIADAIDALGEANPIEGAWNALVDGYLGPEGLPGTVINLTLGMGVQTGADPDTFVPSVRTAIQLGVKDIANALYTPVVTGTAAVRSAAADIDAQAEVEAPAAELTASDVKADATTTDEAPTADAVTTPVGNGADTATAGGSDAPAKTVTKHRVTRKAASDN